jgi:anti-sigma regulatory factor (Ser/Thr protein kinase)
LEERPIGGLGIYMARQCMDGMTYRREDGKNVTTVRKEWLVTGG